MLGFLRNEETIFSVERCSYFFFGLFCKMENIGDDVEKIRIGHDGSGLGAGWYLAKVEVRKFISSGKVKETTSHLDASFIFIYEGVCLCVYKIAGGGLQSSPTDFDQILHSCYSCSQEYFRWF